MLTSAFEGLTWNVWADVVGLFDFPFMVHALAAGTAVALAAGPVGWFMVLRRQTFAGHTLSVISFPGAAGAALAGLPLGVGYFGACAAGALALGGIRRGDDGAEARESAATGTIQALALALGLLFVSLYHGLLNGVSGLLFGTFLGITAAQATLLALIALAAITVLVVCWRPLVFASVDTEVARARGVPVRVLSLGYLLVLGLTVAATSQITGAVLVFALLVTPAAAAQQLTARPLLGVLLATGIALAVTWVGLGLAYYSIYPAGFFITTLAFVVYLAARVGGTRVRA